MDARTIFTNKTMCLTALICLLFSCGSHGVTSVSIIDEPSSEQASALDHEKKMEWYLNNGGGCVYTWLLPDSTRMYGCLGHKESSYTRAFSYNDLVFVQNSVPLTLDETAEYLKELSKKDGRAFKIYLTEIAYPISAEFYYDIYLMSYPSSAFFPNDKELWYQFPGGSKGYNDLLERGFIGGN